MLDAKIGERNPEDLDTTLGREIQAEKLSQQGSFPRTGPPDDAQYFPSIHGEGQAAVNHRVAEPRRQIGDLNSDRRTSRHAQYPRCEKSTANRASATRTLLIAITTALVVPIPRLSVLGLMRRPK